MRSVKSSYVVDNQLSEKRLNTTPSPKIIIKPKPNMISTGDINRKVVLKLPPTQTETNTVNKMQLAQNQIKIKLPKSQLGMNVGGTVVVPVTQLKNQGQRIILNTGHNQPGQVIILQEDGNIVMNTNAEQESSPICIQNTLKTYQKSPKLNTQVQKGVVLPKISIKKDKLFKISPITEPVYDSVASPNILMANRESAIEIKHKPTQIEPVIKTPKITIRKDKLVKIGSIPENLYGQNFMIIKDEQIETDIQEPLIEDKEESLDNTLLLEDNDTVKKSNISIIKDEIIKFEVSQENEPEESDNYYSNIIDDTLQEYEYEEVNTEKIEENEIEFDEEQNETELETEECSVSVNEFNEIIKSEDVEAMDNEDSIDSGLKRLKVVSKDSTFTLLLQAVPKVEKDAIIERLRSQNIEVPRYYTEDFTNSKTKRPQRLLCQFCNQKFTTWTYLEIHMKRHRPDGSFIKSLTVPCSYPNCNRLFSAASKAKMHYNRIHMRPDNETCEVKKRKPQSPKIKTQVPRERNVHCSLPTCNRLFTSERLAEIHYRRVHLGLEIKLEESDKPKFECDFCGKTSTSKVSMTNHVRIHTGERPYNCSHCSKTFRTTVQLQVHNRLHTGECPYQCPSCPKAFRNLSALIRHERVHTGEKPYTCSYCSKSFSQSNSMRLHIRTVHLKLPDPYSKKNRQPRTGVPLI